MISAIMPRKPRRPLPPPTPPECRDTLGISPAALAKRDNRKNIWAPDAPDNEYDRYCDPKNPKAVYHRHVMKAYEILKYNIPPTPLRKSKICEKFGMNLYFKVETGHITGSFHERSAMYTLHKLSVEQRKDGVFTASIGNWAMALAHQGFLMKIPVTVVLPAHTSPTVVKKCQDFRATVVLQNIDEAKTHAFRLIIEQGRVGTYLNGYDHPNVIAGAGCIGIEILNQLPSTDAILVPVGGGALLAGIAAAAKHIKPDILIYGIEPGKSCSFAKAIDNEWPYKTGAEKSLAASLTVPKAGVNAFYTARSLIDKMVLIHDDWTARAMLHMVEEEKIVAEGAGAISLGALMCIPDVLTELHGKKVVCIVSGANIDIWQLKRALVYGNWKAAEGRIFTKIIRQPPGKIAKRNKLLKLLKYTQCNIVHSEEERTWIDGDNILDSCLSLICETKSFKHSTTLKNVIEKLFPGMCEFTGNILEPKTRCVCYPTISYY